MILSELASYLNGELIGNPDLSFTSLSPLDNQKENSISFVIEEKKFNTNLPNKAIAFIVPKKINTIQNQIIVKSTKKALAETINFYLKFKKDTPKKEPIISKLADISLHSVINHSTTISDYTKIYPFCYIGSNCHIGKHVKIYPNVTIYENTIIENNVIIHSGTVVGADGFGYYKENNENKKIHHIGSVLIENDVEIGANSCIDKGCLGETIIKKNTKIDNLIQIAHNTQLGQNTLIASQSGITGSIKIGNNVTIGGQVGIYANIEDNVVIAGKSGVSKKIQKGKIVSGYPAEDHLIQLKKQAFLNRLFKEKKK